MYSTWLPRKQVDDGDDNFGSNHLYTNYYSPGSVLHALYVLTHF
jgi:hypothetical protein